ncbi:MAG: hypothetical protein ACI4JA_09315 [Oscillospiraceae bacterium]
MHKTALKYFAVFIIGALAYGLIEISVRGFSHITMGILGGLTMVVIHILNDQRREGMNFILQIGISALFITAIEFLAGEILNVRLKMNIWDYSEVPLNYDGQICLPFVIFWIMLSVIGTMTDDLLRWKMFREDKNFEYVKRKRIAA